jgi:RNA polymerase sigma factor (sigma-70 family)
MGQQLRTRVDPADIVHDTLLKAHCAMSQFRGRNERQLAAWLNAILTNTIKNAARAQLSSQYSCERLPTGRLERSAVEGFCPVWTTIRNEELRLLSYVLAQIPENQRVVLELRVFDGCSLADIGNRTGRTKASVTGLLYRGMRAVRTQTTVLMRCGQLTASVGHRPAPGVLGGRW